MNSSIHITIAATAVAAVAAMITAKDLFVSAASCLLSLFAKAAAALSAAESVFCPAAGLFWVGGFAFVYKIHVYIHVSFIGVCIFPFA